MANRQGFLIYFDTRSAWTMLSEEQRGILLMSIMDYCEYGVIPNLSDKLLEMAWSFMKPKLDRDAARYENKCIKNSYSVYCREQKKKEQEPLEFSEWFQQQSCRTISNDIRRYQTETETETITETERFVDVFSALAVDDPQLLTALREFEKMRIKIGKPLTDAAKKMLIDRLNMFPADKWIPILEQSIFNNWKDIYPLDDKRRSCNEEPLNQVEKKLEESYQMMKEWAKESSIVPGSAPPYHGS